MKLVTKSTRAKDIQRAWHEVDMSDNTLGRVATKIAVLLMGKRKPYFVRHLDCGDYVVVTNAQNTKVTGNKLTQKVYTSYSGYPGGLRKEALREFLERNPEEVVRRAVLGMLPKNKLRDQLLKRLYIYPGIDHPHKDKFSAKS